MDYFHHFPNADKQAILQLLQEKENWLNQGKKGVERFRQPYESVRHIRAAFRDFSGDMVRIGRAEELSE